MVEACQRDPHSRSRHCDDFQARMADVACLMDRIFSVPSVGGPLHWIAGNRRYIRSCRATGQKTE